MGPAQYDIRAQRAIRSRGKVQSVGHFVGLVHFTSAGMSAASRQRLTSLRSGISRRTLRRNDGPFQKTARETDAHPAKITPADFPIRGLSAPEADDEHLAFKAGSK